MKKFLLILLTHILIAACAAEQNFERLILTDFQRQSINKLSYLYGYTRYFYPNPYIDDVDWYGLLQNSIKEIISFSDEKEVNDYLQKTFSILNPHLILASSELECPSLSINLPFL